jgi:hypothetical protein
MGVTQRSLHRELKYVGLSWWSPRRIFKGIRRVLRWIWNSFDFLTSWG